MKLNFSMKIQTVKYLYRSKVSIYGKCKELNLKKVKEISKLFQNILNKRFNKEICYILGLIWADGYVDLKNSISLEIKEEDGKDIRNIMMIVENWNISYRDRESKMIRFRKYKKELIEILIEYNFDKKSLKSPDKLLKDIPENLHYMFFRGLSDGDGCFYINKKQYLYQYSISSSYNQDWNYISNLCEKIDCDFKIIKRKKEESSDSMIRITNNTNIRKIGNYLYPNGWDYIGFKRKYNKWEEMNRVMTDTSSNKKRIILSEDQKTKIKLLIEDQQNSRDEIMSKYNISKSTYNRIKKSNFKNPKFLLN